MKANFYPWLVVGLLCVVGCLNYLDRMMITTMRSSIVEAIPMSDAQFGLLTAVFLWIYGILSPFAGFMADKFSRSKVIIFSLLVWSLVTWLTSFATSFPHLLITRALMGISESFYAPAALALIMDYHQNRTRSLANSIHIAGIMAGQSLGFIGGWMAESRSWNYAFSMFGIVGIVYSLILLFVLKDPSAGSTTRNSQPVERDKTPFLQVVKILMSNPAYLRALAVWGLLGIVGWLIIGWLPTYLKEQFSLSQTMAGVYATAYVQTAAFLGVIIGGILADRWSRTNPRARLMVPILGLCFAAPAIFLASYTTVLWTAVACFMVYSFTRIFTDGNMMPILCLIIDERFRATGYGILNFFACLVGGISLYAGGAIRDANIELKLIYQIGAALMLVCIILLYRIKPRQAEKHDPHAVSPVAGEESQKINR